MIRAALAAAAVVVLAVAAAGGAATRRGPIPVTKPRVVGQPVVGAPLTARTGNWHGLRPLRFAYRWQRCSTAGTACVAVGRGVSYTPAEADTNQTLRVLVRATNRRGSRVAVSRPTAPVQPVPVVDAAGDIACDPTSPEFAGGAGTKSNCKEKAVSDLLVADNPAAVLPLGDNQYECGRANAFAASYNPTWGRLKAVTHPVLGNHEYGRVCNTDDPTPYFDYFGAAAGPRYQGWYSYDLGTWHLIALNSECGYGTKSTPVGGCQAGSAEETWLRHDLATHDNQCTLAYWHEPRFSSGEHGDAQQMATIWNDLAAAHADVVLSGHNHDYERFDPIGAAPQSTHKYQNPVPDPNGIREFVVGTGGRNTYPFKGVPPLAAEAVRNDTAYGVLRLTLAAGSYSWTFEPAQGSTFTDSGSGTCH